MSMDTIEIRPVDKEIEVERKPEVKESPAAIQKTGGAKWGSVHECAGGRAIPGAGEDIPGWAMKS